MKRIGLLSSMLGAGLLQLRAQGGGWKAPYATAAPARNHRNVGRFSSYLYLPTARTTAARYWHNPADPVQAARIEAAAAKRERKSLRRMLNAERSTNGWLWTREPLLTVEQITTFDQNHVNY